jgi:putative multiple sugar transport system permease protein
MVSDTITEKSQPGFGEYFRKNIREYGLLIALVVIMLFFQIITGGVLFRPVNIWRWACC